MISGPRFRFAPSPTGFFHVGGARTALYNWALAKRLGGTFVLRIEDTDEARNRPEWTQGIIDALAWIGIHDDDAAFEGPYFQSTYAEAHLAAAQRLFEAGAAYYCDLTSEQIQERAKATGASGYDGYSRDRGLGPAPGRVLRFRVPEGSTTVHDLVRGDVVFEHSTIEDFVLLRGNGTPMFLLANVVDDMEMQISHVVRAEEHLPNTPKQQMLWEALGGRPPAWAHVPLLVNEQRKKLSKRRDKVAVEQYRAEGYLADAMVNYLMTLGWSPPGDQEIVPWSTIERDFRLEDVNHSPAFFDIKKLAAFNGEYIRMLGVEEFIEACQPFLHSDDVPWPPERFDAARFAALASRGAVASDDIVGGARCCRLRVPGRPRARRAGVGQDHRDSRREGGAGRDDRGVSPATGMAGGGAEGHARGGGRAARPEEGQGAGADPGRGHRSNGRSAAVRGARGAGPRGSRRDA